MTRRQQFSFIPTKQAAWSTARFGVIEESEQNPDFGHRLICLDNPDFVGAGYRQPFKAQ